MHKNDVAAFADRSVCKVVDDRGTVRNLLRRERRVVVPVLGVDLVTDGDVTHALRQFERAHLIFGIGSASTE